MTLKDKISGLVNGVGEPEQIEIEAALSDLRAAEKLQIEISAKREALHRNLAAQERALGDAALLAETSGNDAEYQKAKASIGQLREEADRLDNAETAANLRIATAKRSLHVAGRERHVKIARKQSTLRNKYAGQVAEALATAIHSYEKLLEHSDRIAAASPVSLFGLGLAVEQDDINRLISAELARVQPNSRPGHAFPGSEYPIYGDPAKATPFVEAIAQCNERLVELVAEAPAAIEPVSMAVLEDHIPAKPDPNGFNEEPGTPKNFEVINPNPTEFPTPDNRRKTYGKPDSRLGEVL